MSHKGFSRFTTLSSALAMAAVLGACAPQDEAPPEAPFTPTPQQRQIFKEEWQKQVQMENARAAAKLATWKSESVDGKGRIVYDKNLRQLTIYKAAPEAFHQPLDSFRKDLADRQISSAFKRGGAIKDDDDLRSRINQGFQSRRFSDEILFSQAATVKVDSGRVCEKNPVNSKTDDCFFASSVNPHTQLGKDLALASRRLGLKL